MDTYTFDSHTDIYIYLIIIILMEIARYYLFELFKKIIKKYTLNRVYKILDGIISFGYNISGILFYFKIL